MDPHRLSENPALKFKCEHFDDRSSSLKVLLVSVYITPYGASQIGTASATNENIFATNYDKRPYKPSDKVENKQYNLAVSIFDTKLNRIFLKKMQAPLLSLQDFYIGNIISLLARRMEIIDYGDNFTKEFCTQTVSQQTATIVIEKNDFLMQHLDSILIQAQKLNLNLMEAKTCEQIFVLKFIGAGNELAQFKHTFGTFLKDSAESPEETLRVEPRILLKNIETCIEPSSRTSILIIKPHILKQNLLGSVFNHLKRHLENNEIRISRIALRHFSKLNARRFYEVYTDLWPKGEFNLQVNELASGPSFCLLVETTDFDLNIVTKVREICGPNDLELAFELRPESIRAKFASSKSMNAVHSTDLAGDVDMEAHFVFTLLAAS